MQLVLSFLFVNAVQCNLLLFQFFFPMELFPINE